MMLNKRFYLLILTLLLVFPLSAPAELDYWICPECGQGANNGNYCTNCAAPSPAPSDVNDNLTQIPGETDHVMVDILRIDGSSFVKAKKNKYLYAPEKACDEDESTCWQFTAKKNAEEKGWLSLIIEGEDVDEIWIRNGNRIPGSKGKDQYLQYARPKEIQVLFDYPDREQMDIMEFTLSEEKTDSWEKLDVGRHENVYSVWIVIRSVYKGTKKANIVCLSDVMLVQRAPAEKANPPWR